MENSISLIGSQVCNRFGNFEDIAPKLHPVKVQSSIIELDINSNKLAYLRENSIRLSQFTGAYSKDNTYKIIELWLYDLSEFAGVKVKLTPEQLKQTAVLFYSEAFMLNFTELGLFFNRVKKGRYGDFYGSVDPIRIMSFLAAFMIDRKESIESIERDKSNNERRQADIDWNDKKSNITDKDREEISTTINNFIKQTLVR